jgi:hypothetical protein
MFASGPTGNDAVAAFGSANQQSASQLFGSQDHPIATGSPFNTSGYNPPTPAHAPELTRHESASSVFSTHSAQSATFVQPHSGLTGVPGSTPSTPSASSAFSHGAPSNEPSSFGYTDRHGQSPSSDSHPPKHPQRGAHAGYETNEFFYATSRQAHHGFGHGSGDASSFYGSSQATEAQQFVEPNAALASADAFFGQSTSSTGASIGGTSAPSTPGAASASSWFEGSRSSATGPPELQRGSSNVSSAHNDQQLGSTSETQQWSSSAEVAAGSYESTIATDHTTAAETTHHGQEAAVFGHHGDQNEYAQGESDATSVFAANTSDASFEYGSSYGQFSHEQQVPTPGAFASPPVDAPTEHDSTPQLTQHDAVPSTEDVHSDVKNNEPHQVVEATEPATTEQQQEQEQQPPEIQAQDEGTFATPYDGFGSAPSSAFDQSGSGDFASTPFDQGSTSADLSASASPFDSTGDSPSLFSAPPPQEGGGFEGASQQNDFFASAPPADGASSFFSDNGYASEVYGQQVQQHQDYGTQAAAGTFGANANQSGTFFGQQQHHQQYQEQYAHPGQHQQYPQPDHQQQYEQAQQNQQSAYQQQYQQDQFEIQQQQQQSITTTPQVASPQNQFQQTAIGGYDQGYSSVQNQQYQHPAPQLQQFPTARPAGLNRAYASPGFGAAKSSVTSPVPSPALSSLAAATHSPAVKTSNKYKDTSCVAPSCLVAFGFGGNVVTMFPKRKLLLNIAGSSFRNSPRTAVYVTLLLLLRTCIINPAIVIGLA